MEDQVTSATVSLEELKAQRQLGEPKEAIVVNGPLLDVLDACEKVLIGREDYFRRGQELVQPIQSRQLGPEFDIQRDGDSVTLLPVTTDSVIQDLLESAVFVRKTNKGFTDDEPERKHVSHLMTRAHRMKGNYRELHLVTTTPVMLPDRTVLEQPSYRSGVLFVPSRMYQYEPLPELPTAGSLSVCDGDREMALATDAIEALKLFYPLLRFFPFIEPDMKDQWKVMSSPSYAVALSAILSLVARPALRTVPLHVLDAPTPGTGKTKVAELCSLAATGLRPTTITYRGSEELEKTLLPLLRSGDRAVLIDNVSKTLYSDKFCTILTSAIHEDRILGQSENIKLRNDACFFATGNNIAVTADLVRRSLKCTLDAEMEKPEGRMFETDAAEVAREMHPVLCRAALMALRCYVLAEMPKPQSYQVVYELEQANRPSLGSFEQWDRLVCGTLRWCGYADPVRTQEALKDADPAREADLSLLHHWYEAFQNTPVTLYEIHQKSEVAEAYAKVFVDLGGAKTWDPQTIGYRLRRLQGKIIGGYRMKKSRGETGAKFWVERLPCLTAPDGFLLPCKRKNFLKSKG